MAKKRWANYWANYVMGWDQTDILQFEESADDDACHYIHHADLCQLNDRLMPILTDTFCSRIGR